MRFVRSAIAWFGLTVALVAQQQPNVLLIIADDLGIDRVGAYAAVPDPGHTPRIDALAAGGILFRNAYADPVCSPSRATMLTGRHAYRTGIGRALNYFLDPIELSTAEVSLPEILAPAYQSSAIGKWHLSVKSLGGLQHPLLMGFEHHRGTITVLDGYIGDAYYDFPKSIDGVEFETTIYNTTDTVDDALDQIADFRKPWFLWLAFNAPHAPFHKPPPWLHTFQLPAILNTASVPIHMKAMTEAMDTEIGRLLDSMNPATLANTIVIFIGDNGTDKQATTAPFLPAHAKGTVYEGGVHVPLIINGPGVAKGAECTALVHSTDIFATVADLAGVAHPTGTDSVSMVPYFTAPAQPSQRAFAYMEYFDPNGQGPYNTRQRAARDARYKLIWWYDHSDTPGTQALFDLAADPFELNNLLAAPLTGDALAAYAALVGELIHEQLPWSDYGHGLAGSGGMPSLTADSTLLGGAPLTLTLTGAAPNAPATLIVGLSYVLKAFKGGQLVPAPDVVMTGLLTDPTGAAVLATHWPAQMPPNLNLYYQYWIVDPTGPKGLTASNALHSITP